MTLPDIALLGRARSGKDTIANYLVDRHGYVRVAFADALKEMALAANPSIPDMLWTDGDPYRLSDAVEADGWEGAKDEYPEVRRFLQGLGVAVRAQQPDFWLLKGEQKAYEAFSAGKPAVFTDVRFLNEVRALEARGFMTVSVTRPCRITEGLDAVDTHVSETELAKYKTDRDICNAGTIADLEEDVRRVVLGM
ncbi:hypothetical protein ACFPA8_07910 [Streptomyces ovatisporus]|uniref:Uncharacterized protein n=1 Tax=Streptomyces ovatisporus TaxID=1128682 RepID=A0ABV9A4M8_9ACTN